MTMKTTIMIIILLKGDVKAPHESRGFCFGFEVQRLYDNNDTKTALQQEQITPKRAARGHGNGVYDKCLTEITKTKLSIMGPDANTDFLVDNVTLYEVPENSNWRTEADTNIEKYRKSDIKLK